MLTRPFLGCLLAASGVLTITLLFACGRSSTVSCDKSQAKLESLSSALKVCKSDIDCPCGASCAVGVCSFECTTDADCSSRSCNERGECVTGGRR